MSGERTFSFSQGAVKAMGAGARAEAGAVAAAEVRARVFKTVLRILCKSSLEYLGTLVVVTEASATGGFIPEGPAGWSDNLSPDSEDGKEPKRITEGATEGATEGRSQQRRLQPRTEVILELISSKNSLPNGLADSLDMEKLKL